MVKQLTRPLVVSEPVEPQRSGIGVIAKLHGINRQSAKVAPSAGLWINSGQDPQQTSEVMAEWWIVSLQMK